MEIVKNIDPTEASRGAPLVIELKSPGNPNGLLKLDLNSVAKFEQSRVARIRHQRILSLLGSNKNLRTNTPLAR
jgi:hypothetical protein